MTKLSWNESGSRFYEAGVDHGVFYPQVGPGIPWNGLVSIKESESEANQHITYIDGQKIRTQLQLGVFVADLSAYTYPLEFEEYDGLSGLELSAQPQRTFHLSYRTMNGNDIDGLDYGYKVHLVFNALASPVRRDYTTLDDTLNPLAFTWNLTTTPVFVPGARPASHFVIDSTTIYSDSLAALEDILYGTGDTSATFPTIEEFLQIFENTAVLKITDHGDGTWTAEGPDDVVQLLDPTTFQIDWKSAIFISADSYTVRSM